MINIYIYIFFLNRLIYIEKNFTIIPLKLKLNCIINYVNIINCISLKKIKF